MRASPSEVNDQQWLRERLHPDRAEARRRRDRGARRVQAASAANAAIDHVHDWVLGTPTGDWVSMAIPSDGSYGVPGGSDLELPGDLRERQLRDRPGSGHRRLLEVRIDVTVKELAEEREAVRDLGLI